MGVSIHLGTAKLGYYGVPVHFRSLTNFEAIVFLIIALVFSRQALLWNVLEPDSDCDCSTRPSANQRSLFIYRPPHTKSGQIRQHF